MLSRAEATSCQTLAKATSRGTGANTIRAAGPHSAMPASRATAKCAARSGSSPRMAAQAPARSSRKRGQCMGEPCNSNGAGWLGCAQASASTRLISSPLGGQSASRAKSARTKAILLSSAGGADTTTNKSISLAAQRKPPSASEPCAYAPSRFSPKPASHAARKRGKRSRTRASTVYAWRAASAALSTRNRFPPAIFSSTSGA